ncbi:type II toxin-antitoxin system RelB/DinJ family antitoxin [Bartonella sp. 1-1C]|uniref:type II toxin-antitoxin system RelB/DinJ family antitoxin n=1 Tax=Bartonella sp. 1-1C TaxID=515256 RepID=UPI0001F4BBF9|nr:type II toxin-antitoxin system RelB/DinJ family antitoxin [Bartonella sp. 1-1C]ATO57107.1 DNA-damage-inducible protein J [Bartonella sp. 1-1C]CBI81111.1 DNA-damage-inducible protein [Bartonella sp. 1-1C]
MGKIQARIPDEIQEVASAVIKSTGLTVSDAVRMFMTRIARDKALPLDLFQPNPETLQAIEDAEMGRVERTSLDDLRAMICEDKAEVCKSAK